MAMIDYGSVVKKNGAIIQKEIFMDMKEAVGFTIKNIQYSYIRNDYDKDYNIIRKRKYTDIVDVDGNYFSYIGDKDLLVCVYKGTLMFISNNEVVKVQRDLWLDYNLPYELQKLDFTVNGVEFNIKRLAKDRNRYKLRFSYKGNLYEVLYGYGVDVDKDVWYDVSKKERRYIDNWFNCSY